MRMPALRRHWREYALIVAALVPLAGILSFDPIAQDPAYHHFADDRAIFGIPNFANVATNALFLVIGIVGLSSQGSGKTANASWTAFFAGVALVCLGSGYYHLRPTDATLVWDRLPITIAFMGLFVAVLSESINESLDRHLLAPALAGGLLSIGWWHWAGDLRLYVWVQFAPALLIPLALLLYPPVYTHRVYLLYSLGFYALAKSAEFYDGGLYALTGGTISGHSLKHLLASVSAFYVYLMLRRRGTA